jgi:uncharacterized membrane protein SirB2
MIELAALQSNRNTKNWDDLTDDQKQTYVATTILMVIIYIIFFVWALTRASKQKNKPVHMLFALVSPVFYLIFSYFVEGFNN